MSYTLLYYIKDNFSSLFVRKCIIYNQKTWRFVRNIVSLQAKSKTNDMKRIKMPLLARIILAILLGVIFGNLFNEAAVRVFLTFNGIFSQFLGFMIPLIIIGLVTPAIADIGHGAGKLLLATVGIAFADTLLAGLLAYGTGSALFPHMIANSAHVAVDKAEELKPFFEIKIPAMVDVMSALVFSFIAGFTIPLCATIHLSGSMMKITCCALTICLINGLPCNLPLFLNFIFVLAICMVAAPGVPGGAVMAALGPLASVLGFNADMQALMIALYIAMDSFGTACNVTGDGAIAVVVDKIFRKDQ